MSKLNLASKFHCGVGVYFNYTVQTEKGYETWNKIEIYGLLPECYEEDDEDDFVLYKELPIKKKYNSIDEIVDKIKKSIEDTDIIIMRIFKWDDNITDIEFWMKENITNENILKEIEKVMKKVTG